MALRPVRLEIEGFRSFRKRTVFDFPKSGLCLIAGKWIDSEATSGVGKSVPMMAMAFALDICDVPATDLKNWDSKKIFVQLTLADEVNTYIVTRDPKLSLIINGTPYESMTKGAKEKLADILCSSPELVKDLTYREQRKPGKFINSTDSQKKEFLAILLKLTMFEAADDIYSKESSDITKIIQLLANDIANAQNNLTMFQVSELEVSAAQDAVNTAQARIASFTAGTAAIELNNQLVAAVQSMEHALGLKSKSASATREREYTKVNLMNLKKDIDSLKQNMCPTCSRNWDNQQALLGQKESQFSTLLGQFEQSGIFIAQCQPIIDQIPAMEAQKSQITLQLGALQAPVQDAQQTLYVAKQSLNQLIQKQTNRNNVEKTLNSKTQELTTKQKRLIILEHCAKIVGRNGFMGSIFDEVLREIETRTNDMLIDLPNVSQYTISLSSTTVTKTSGIAKKEISTKIYKNGKETSYKSLSGGQQVALELCADLAYSETIRSRTGSVLGWMCLDEAMEGFGVEEKQAAINMIKHKVKGLVLIIDHATEIKEGFEKVIEIRYNGKESNVLNVL